jgi:hypothetical protein
MIQECGIIRSQVAGVAAALKREVETSIWQVEEAKKRTNSKLEQLKLYHIFIAGN